MSSEAHNAIILGDNLKVTNSSEFDSDICALVVKIMGAHADQHLKTTLVCSRGGIDSSSGASPFPKTSEPFCAMLS